jgi:hypothetical protein
MNAEKPAQLMGSLRRAARYSPVADLRVEYEGRSEKIVVRPPDLSPKGMFINTAQHFPEGAILKMSFRVPTAEDYIRARCEVRYCLHGVGIGVEFVEIAPEAITAIEQHIYRGSPKRLTKGARAGRIRVPKRRA